MEFKAMFGDERKTVWGNDLLRYMANKLATLTGLRCYEVLGLRGEYVYDDHIYLYAQHDEYGYSPTKTKIQDNVPLTLLVIKDLMKLKAVNGDGFIFSLDGGVTPVSRKHIFNGLTKALNNIGVSGEKMKRRGLSQDRVYIQHQTRGLGAKSPVPAKAGMRPNFQSCHIC